MDLRSATPFWLLRSGLIGTWPAADRDARCDVVVIGAGITGALVAHALVKEGVDVLVLDRREAVLGSTVASTGLLLYETDTELGELARRVGEGDAVRAWRLGVEAIDRLERICAELGEGDFNRRETVYFASRASHARRLRREYELRRRQGFDVDLLDRADLRRGPDAELAILSRENAQVDPYRLTHALLRDVYARGGRVFDRTEMTEVMEEGAGVTLRTSRDTVIRARAVVFATGYESEHYLGRGIGTLYSTFAAVSEPLESFDEWPHRRMMWETARPYLYLRTTPDRRAIVGGADLKHSEAHGRPGVIARRSRRLVERLRRILPGLPFETAFSWGGTFGSTPDGLPRIGADPGRPWAWFALGYGGNGITFAMIAAGIITDCFLGRGNRDAELFRLTR